MQQRLSHVRKDINAVPFARGLLAKSFADLDAKTPKDAWDWYWLGICYGVGRGTSVDHSKAAGAFRTARLLGNCFAEFEEIWTAFLSGMPAQEAIARLKEYSGPLQTYAKLSAAALTTLAIGPSVDIGNSHHVFRVLEISNLLREFYYHKGGSQHINIAVEAEMRQDIEQLKQCLTATSALALFIISKSSRRNPTGDDPSAWLRKSVHPENSALIELVMGNHLSAEDIQLASNICQQNGWEDSDLGLVLARKQMENDEDS